MAQSWPEEYKWLTHNRPVDQVYGNCGQNIFISSALTSWYKWPVHLHFFHQAETNPAKNRIFKGQNSEGLVQRGR